MTFSVCGLTIFLLLSSGSMAQLLDMSTIKDLVLSTVMECATENEVPVRDVIIMIQNIPASSDDLNNSTKCFVFCLMNRFSIMEDNGEFMVDLLKLGANMIPNRVIKNIVVNNLEPIITKSSIVPDPCERAVLFLKVSYKTYVLNPNVQAVLTLAKSAVSKLSGTVLSRVG